MSQKINLLDLKREELEKFIAELGFERFRAKQVSDWLNKAVLDFDEMKNLPKNLRDALKEKSVTGILKIRRKLQSEIDETAKYLLDLEDGNVIESVLMKYKHGYTVCISSQVGCRMGCTFCASTGIGFDRNLTSGEMLGQVLTISRDAGVRVSNIVIMGIGEPLDNYDNVIKFMKQVNDPDGLNIGLRHISLSTCGLVPQIIRLSKEGLPITLSVSLHAPNDDLRRKIMPIARKYSIDKIIEACKIYTRTTKRRITMEYALIDGVNDGPEHALELAKLLKGMLCHVNLIPVNSVEGTNYRKSGRQRIENFVQLLEKHGIQTTVRRELGEDINAACGQLRRGTTSDFQPL